jgi:hypothetical protein
MADLPRETPIRVFPDLTERGGGTSHDTTWGEFCDDNKDGLDAAELSDMGACLAIGDEVAGGGGAQPMFMVVTTACPYCDGAGEIGTGMPPRGTFHDDPEFEHVKPCPTCGGTGKRTADDGRPSAEDMGLDDDSYPPRCTNPGGHVWVVSDEDDRSYCEQCGADGDA